jgi:hypothetical protein
MLKKLRKKQRKTALGVVGVAKIREFRTRNAPVQAGMLPNAYAC